MKRGFDVVDALVAAGLAASIILWASIWAHPYPHPDLWPFLARMRHGISLGILSAAGKLCIGAFASLAYLNMRASWMRHRDIEDDLPDGFFLTRFAPLCGAALFALLPCAWRSAQFLSPRFALLTLVMAALFLWQVGRCKGRMLLYFLSYVLASFVGGMEPLAVAVLGYFGICDIVRRCQEPLANVPPCDAYQEMRRRSAEITLSSLGAMVGAAAAILVGSVYYTGAIPDGGIPAVAGEWWDGWQRAVLRNLVSWQTLIILSCVGGAAVAMALGRRLRAFGPRGRPVSIALACVVAVAAFVMLLRAVDSGVSVRLGLVREYVRLVAEDAQDASWLFTDGRFDDALKFEFRRRGLRTVVLNALMPPSAAEADALRALAPEPGDRAVFAAGGAEVFRAWARERPDRLLSSSWQLGSKIVRRFSKVEDVSAGSVMRAVTNGLPDAYVQADARFSRFSGDLVYVAEHPSQWGALFGGIDKETASKFDALLWRAARMAGERSDALARRGDANGSQQERALMGKLDGYNVSLKAQGEIVERLLPTANIVLTPREALDIALRRADFRLAERYANEVRLSDPGNVSANFALGMARVEERDYFEASRHFERVLAVRPNEPTTLHNLSLVYGKLGKTAEARSCAERAAAANPKSVEIMKNLDSLRRAGK